MGQNMSQNRRGELLRAMLCYELFNPSVFLSDCCIPWKQQSVTALYSNRYSWWSRAYDRTMRHKLGLLELEHDGDEELMKDLLEVDLQITD